MILIDGKKVSQTVREEIKKEISEISEQGKHVGLAVIIIGDDPASQVYVRNKINACNETGILSRRYAFPANVSETEIIELIETLNNDNDINGILVQLPLPKHLNKERILSAIDPKKDVDGFSAEQSGKTFLGEEALSGCTPEGIITLLKAYNIKIEGLNAVVIGRSNIVGKPAAILLLKENATVTVCHTRTKDIKLYTKNADLIIVAVGKPKFLTEDMVKDGVIVIDAGINRTEEGKLCGDVDFENVSKKCSYITPVPGGVGPMTVTMLMYNTLKAFKNA